MTDHPITPPYERVREWLNDFHFPCPLPGLAPGEAALHIAARAAQWGADQELEACAEWAANTCPLGTAKNLRTARRPKPPSLKERALEDLHTLLADLKRHGLGANIDNIRRALKTLND